MPSDAYGRVTMRNSTVFGINISKKARMSESQMKTLLITFFDKKVIVHFEFLPQS